MNKIANAVGATVAFWSTIISWWIASGTYSEPLFIMCLVLTPVLFWVTINQTTKFIAKSASGNNEIFNNAICNNLYTNRDRMVC